MPRVLIASFSILGAVLFLSCTHAEKIGTTATAPLVQNIESRHPATSRSAALPDQNIWQPLYDYADALNIANPDVTLGLSKGGTSVYGVINIGGKAIGCIIPENSAASVSGETFAFTLARVLGISEIYQPGVYHFLTGDELTAFMKIVPTEPMKIKNREDNRKLILKRFAEHPEGFDAVFKRWDAKPYDYEAMGSTGKMNVSHVLSGSRNSVSSLLSCQGPRPNPATVVTLNGGTNNELEITREMSSILLIDALTQQWDRFSGGNLQTVTNNGRVTLVSYDNGGTWGGTKVTKKNLSYVTRFDANVARQILDMDDFLSHRQSTYLGLQNEEQFVIAFDIKQAPAAFKKFKKSLELVAEHIRANPNCTF